MFKGAACFAIAFIAWRTSRLQNSDPEDVATNIRHSRQDLRLIAYLLFAILVALGVIADRI
jgi:hypothetical protein